MVFHRITQRIVNKKLSIRYKEYNLVIALAKKNKEEKEIDRIEKKFKNGKSLSMDELTKLQENDRL